MVIYGVALLSGCMLAGIFLGAVLGELIGVEANVGGVGIAMLLLILLSDALRRRGRLKPPTRQGVLFWSAIYIPVVVAMAASQNVIAAVRGGPAAVLAGAAAVVLGFALVPVLSGPGNGDVPPGALPAAEAAPYGDVAGKDGTRGASGDGPTSGDQGPSAAGPGDLPSTPSPEGNR